LFTFSFASTPVAAALSLSAGLALDEPAEDFLFFFFDLLF
jgi:hypothetical protein